MMSAVFLLCGMGLVLGLVIAIAVKVFAVDVDPRLEEIENLLPSANCGACGFAGCADFARALLAGEATPEQCPSTPHADAERLAALLGVAVGERVQKVALVRCGGDDSRAARVADYNGVKDCKSASLVVSGFKGCLYGCLGLGTCSRVCPFAAIEMTPEGLAVVHPDACTGCGKCVAACPRGLITLVPKSAPVHVFCNNPDKGAASAKVCKVSCIACRKCVKAAGEGQMTMDGFLARVNYDDPPGSDVAAVCPTHCIQLSLLQTPAAPAAAETHEVAHV